MVFSKYGKNQVEDARFCANSGKKGIVIAAIFVAIAAAAIIVLSLTSGSARLTKALGNSAQAFEQSAKALALPDCSVLGNGEGISLELSVDVESLPDNKELEGMGVELEGSLKAADESAELTVSTKAAGQELLELSVSLEEDTLCVMVPDIAGEKVYSVERGELDAVLAELGLEDAGAEEKLFSMLDDLALLSNMEAARKEALPAFEKEAVALLGELEIESGGKLGLSVNGVEMECRLYQVSIPRESIYKLAEEAEKLTSAGSDTAGLSFSGSGMMYGLPELLTELGDSNGSIVLELGVSDNNLVYLGAEARAYGEDYSLRAEIGGKSYTDNITVKLTDASGEGWILESAGEHSGSSFSDHSVLSALGGDNDGKKLLVSQLHRSGDGSFELELSWAQGEKGLLAEGVFTGVDKDIKLKLNRLEIYSMGSLKVRLGFTADIGGYSASSKLDSATERVTLTADTVKDELYSLAGALNSWITEKGALLPEKFADRICSDKFKLTSALMGTVSAWNDSAEELGLSLPEWMKEGKGFGLELELALKYLPYMRELNGLGVDLGLDVNGEERFVGLMLRSSVADKELARLCLSLEDALLCLSAPDFTHDKVYSLDTEKLGEFLGTFGVPDPELQALEINLFDIAELYGSTTQKFEQGSEALNAGFAALAEELEIRSGGSSQVNINGNVRECDLYSVSIYSETLRKALRLIKDYEEQEMQALTDFFAEMTDMGLPEEAALEIMWMLAESNSEWADVWDDLGWYIDSLSEMNINVAVCQGRIAQAELRLPVDGDEYITIGLELGGGDKYCDDAAFTISNSADEAYCLTSHSERRGDSIENRMDFSYIYAHYGVQEEIFSLNSKYTPAENGGEFESLFMLEDGEYGFAKLQGSIETGESLSLELDSIELFEDNRLQCELGLNIGFESFDGSGRQGEGATELSGMSLDELEKEWNCVAQNADIWVMGIYARYPDIIDQFM